MLKELFDKIRGYKTYGIVALSIIYALSALGTGHMDQNTAIEMILAALGGASMRSAIRTQPTE